MNELLQSLDIETPELFKEDKKRGLTIFKGTLDNRIVIIKIVGNNNKQLITNMEKEKLCSDLFQTSIDFNFINVLSSGQTDKYFWVTREYVEGDSFANTQKAYDVLNPRYNQAEIIQKTIENFYAFQKISIDYKKLGQFSPKFPYTERDRENLTHSFGDLNPANIIIDLDNKVYFSDYEWVCLDNPMMDIVYLWLFLWRDKNLQGFWKDEFVKTEQDEDNFRHCIVRILKTFPWDDQNFLNNEHQARNKEWYDCYMRASS